jgi:AcrR family transcriptional regulator
MTVRPKPRRPHPGGERRRVAAQPRRPSEPLSRERIADAAMALVDREGLDALSFRRLAADLGCEAMSIYHHVPSKAHLMDTLIDIMLAEIVVPTAAAEADWMERLRMSAHSFRAMALKHPEFFSYFAVHRLNTMRGVTFIDAVIGILREAGFSDGDAARYFREIGYYLTGAALDETAGYAKGPSAVEPVGEAVIMSSFAHLAAAAPYFQPKHFQETFEVGLEMLLDAIQRAHGGIRSVGGPGRD